MFITKAAMVKKNNTKNLLLEEDWMKHAPPVQFNAYGKST